MLTVHANGVGVPLLLVTFGQQGRCLQAGDVTVPTTILSAPVSRFSCYYYHVPGMSQDSLRSHCFLHWVGVERYSLSYIDASVSCIFAQFQM